jgi:nitroreductase
MEAWDAYRARRNVREYSDRPIAAEDLDRILEAGRRAPSASNRQPWDFVVVTDRTALVELAKVWQGAGHIARSTATIVLVRPVGADARQEGLMSFDLGQAAMGMAVVAADLGIGSGHASIGDQALARQLLGVPETHWCAYMLALGYPADRPLKPMVRPARRPFEEVVHRGRW